MALTDDLIAYWKLDTTGWVDSHTNGLDLTDVNSVANPSGILNNCANFAGGGKRLTRSDSSTINPTAALSASFWIKGSGSIAGVTGKWVSADGGWGIVRWVDDDMRCYIGTTGSDYSNYGLWSGVNDGTSWFHVVLTYDGSGSTNADKMKVYVNGTAKTISFTGTIPGSLLDSAANFEMGRTLAGSGVGEFGGNLDEYALWSRAITSSEVTEIYNSGSPLPYDDWGGGGGVVVPVLYMHRTTQGMS